MCHKVTSFENMCDKVFEKNCSIQTLNDHVLPWIWMIYNNHGLVFLHTTKLQSNSLFLQLITFELHGPRVLNSKCELPLRLYPCHTHDFEGSFILEYFRGTL